MARRSNGLRNRKGKPKVDPKVFSHHLDYYEGFSPNQVKIVLREFSLDFDKFNKWIGGQTCPLVPRYDENGNVRMVGGVYGYDLFRWIENQKKGTPLIWD